MGKSAPPDPALFRAVLKELRDGSPPFISLAAERAGVNRNTVKTWIFQGDHGNPAYTEFAQEVRRIRSKYMGDSLKELASITKEHETRGKQLNWILQRLDREEFDPPREVVKAERDDGSFKRKPQAVDPAKVKAAAEDLAEPEDETNHMH